MPQIEKHAMNILRLRKGEEIYFKIMKITFFFSASVYQSNITFSVVCMCKFFFISLLFLIICFLAGYCLAAQTFAKSFARFLPVLVPPVLLPSALRG